MDCFVGGAPRNDRKWAFFNSLQRPESDGSCPLIAIVKALRYNSCSLGAFVVIDYDILMSDLSGGMKMKSGRQKYSIFLTPAPEDFAYTDNLIRELSAKYDADPFEPHVTVYAGWYDDLELLKATLVGAVTGVPIISLAVRGIGFSHEYFKTLFIDFEENAVLRTVHERFRAGIGFESGYVLAPHLSLLYKDMPVHEKETLSRMVELEREEIHFDMVKIMTPANQSAGWKDAKQWKTLYRSCLDGG